MPFFLIKPLNTKFDPDLKRHVTFLQYFGGISSRATRAGFYANLVVGKHIFGKNQPHYENYDFRSKISRNTCIACWVYTVLLFGTLFILMPVMYILGKWAA